MGGLQKSQGQTEEVHKSEHKGCALGTNQQPISCANGLRDNPKSSVSHIPLVLSRMRILSAVRAGTKLVSD